MMRDFNREARDSERRYAYEFDNILRHYMMKSFTPFVRDFGLPVLEMGCYRGEFTEILKERFADVSVIEAADELVEFTQNRVGSGVRFFCSTFEDFESNQQFETIFLMHTLEHLDNPKFVLNKVSRWLSDTGRLFLVCPNANAPSRQIAVKMGLIPYNSAVTESERIHGHRKTYSLDTLEEELQGTGLRAVQRGGIFFKALANYQFDELLKTEIIGTAYLDGCYELGMIYPDLCASIFLICEKDNSQS